MSSAKPTDTVDCSSATSSSCSSNVLPMVHQRTIDNIKENYRREFASSSKYALYAKQLQEQGYESLANLFYACSHSECIHSVRHSRVAMFLGIKLETEVVQCQQKSAAEILNEMIQEELASMKNYPRFIEEARHDKSSSAILSMTIAMKADHSHYEYFQEAAASEDFWKSEQHQFYVCSLCGFIHHWTRVACPVCGARPELFLPFPGKERFNPEALCFESQEDRSSMAIPEACGVWNFDYAYPTCLINAVEFTSEIADELHKQGWSDRDVYAIVLSLTEAAANSSEHGNKRQEDKYVFVECSISNDFFFCNRSRSEYENWDNQE